MILGWISIWASLSFNPFKINQFIDYINFENITKTDLFELLDISRGLFQILYMIPLLVVFFSLFEVKKVFSKSNIIFFLFSILFLIETVSLLKTENLNMNIFFIICSFNTILTLFLLKNFFSEEDIILMFKLNILFLFILIIFFGAQYILVAYKNGVSQGNLFTAGSGKIYVPAFTIANGSLQQDFFNFGNSAATISSGNSDGNGYGNFEYAVPSGYYALNTKNLAEFG